MGFRRSTGTYYGKNKKEALIFANQDKGLIWSGVSASKVRVRIIRLSKKNVKVGFSKQKKNSYHVEFEELGLARMGVRARKISRVRKLKKPVKERGKRRTVKLKKKTKRGRKLDRSKRSQEAHEIAYWGI